MLTPDHGDRRAEELAGQQSSARAVAVIADARSLGSRIRLREAPPSGTGLRFAFFILPSLAQRDTSGRRADIRETAGRVRAAYSGRHLVGTREIMAESGGDVNSRCRAQSWGAELTAWTCFGRPVLMMVGGVFVKILRLPASGGLGLTNSLVRVARVDPVGQEAVGGKTHDFAESRHDMPRSYEEAGGGILPRWIVGAGRCRREAQALRYAEEED